MIRFFLILTVFIINTSKAGANPSEILHKAIPSVVSIYSVNYKNKDAIKIFLNSSSTDGNTGSGVIIDKSGLIVTNYHVIRSNPYIKVILNNRKVYQAKLINFNETIDLALIKIDLLDSKIVPIEFGVSKNISIGDPVLAIGNPFGIGISVSAGIVSALPVKNSIGMGHLIQTDALLNPGNSGGALLDKNGNLIGINTFIFSKQGNFSGIGFAIPSDLVKLFVDRSLQGKSIKQYWLGVSGINVTDEIARKINLEIPRGVIITEIYKNAPGERAKLQIGDVLLQIGESQIKTVSELAFIIASFGNSDPRKLVVFREGKILELEIKPEEPLENVPSDKRQIKGGILDGLIVANNSYAIAYETNSNPSESGVVIYDISSDSFVAQKLAFSNGILKGDIIYSINGKKFINVEDFIKFIKENSNLKSYNMILKRNNNTIELNIYR